ncbi:MAG: NADH-quinone oxidoreductase subunit NuoE [Deltaproteobacteria bacterium]|nr:NADH-quinone oxidoreductase subunit NuoE [Deltaproteobacteria bacterium]
MDLHRKYDFKNHHFAGEEGRLIPLLQQAQAMDGYITRDRIHEIHKNSGIPLTHIYGVATFYSQFRFKPVGKYMIRVCHGTACHVSGAKDITEACQDHLAIPSGETTADRLFTLETVACLGCCSLAPVIMINNDTFGNLSPKDVKKIINRYKKEGPKEAAQ